MTDVREVLAGIKARAEAATPGPWRSETIKNNYGHNTYIPDVERFREHLNSINLGEDQATAEFIAAARSDVPRLVAAVEVVLDQHKPSSDGAWCTNIHCRALHGYRYPCPTVATITSALEAS